MIKRLMALGMLTAAGLIPAMPAQAQVRDAEYRGTLVCERLPFAQDPARTAIVIKLTGNEGPYERPVYAGRSKPDGKESGTAKVDGDKIALTGAWKGEKDSYEASYTGSFVRRRAKLAGTQKWVHDGQSFTRNCSGAIERPLAGFLPKQQKPAQ
jgi:hypothetical protein